MLWPIILLALLGLILLAVEVIVPGLIVGTFGIIALIAAIVLSYQNFGFETGSLMLVAIVFVTCAGFMLWLYLFPRTFIGRRLMLNSVSGATRKVSLRASLVGETGAALTHLRPAGTASLGGKRVDVVAESGYIEAGERVRVVSTDGMRVVVRLER